MNILKKLNFFDKLMAAISFAEAGEHKTAMQFLESETKVRKQAKNQQADRARRDRRPAMRM